MRLIDVDALRDKMYHEAFETDTPDQKWDSGCWIRYKMFERNIENAPTVDAAPVRHGSWKTCKDGTLDCSVCHCIAPYEGNNYGDVLYTPEYDYCPNCGARMDGEENG